MNNTLFRTINRKPFAALLCFLLATVIVQAQKKILFFASYENTYYSEYIVAIQALEKAGYTVDIRSAGLDSIGCYMNAAEHGIETSAESLSGSSYSEFAAQFQDNFGSPWNATLNQTPSYVYSDGSILDVVNMDAYDALVIAGGTGILDYRYDGSYLDSGTGSRALTAAQMKQLAEKLNELANQALNFGKPILAQCHGASLPVFWRIPITTGSGEEALGFSLLKGQNATGYPDANTTSDYASLFVNHTPANPVLISGTNEQFVGFKSAASKIITSRDWYPQTVSLAVRTLLNVLESFLSPFELDRSYKVLIIHGGAINPLDCNPANKNNDIPCNYGTGATDLPADFNTLKSLLTNDSPQDYFLMQVSDVNLSSSSLPFDPTSKSQVVNYLRKFDGVVFFKHWSTDLTIEIQEAIVAYADLGGGVVGLHHALYNGSEGGQSKDILVNQLFGAQSSADTWSAALENYDVYSTNYGHFVSSFTHPYTGTSQASLNWLSNPLPTGVNNGFSEFPVFSVYDEIYDNMAFVPGQTFGRNLNQIQALFSNNSGQIAQEHTTGFVKLFDANLDFRVGRVAYFQIGERVENLLVSHPYGQVVRNAVIWSAKNYVSTITGIDEKTLDLGLRCYPNPANDGITLVFDEVQELRSIQLCDLAGRSQKQFAPVSGKQIPFDLQQIPAGTYLLSFEVNGLSYCQRIVVH